MCPLHGDVLSVTFDQETAEIRWRIVTHPALMEDQPWDLNRTWPVGRVWCRFIIAPPQKKSPEALP